MKMKMCIRVALIKYKCMAQEKIIPLGKKISIEDAKNRFRDLFLPNLQKIEDELNLLISREETQLQYLIKRARMETTFRDRKTAVANIAREVQAVVHGDLEFIWRVDEIYVAALAIITNESKELALNDARNIVQLHPSKE